MKKMLKMQQQQQTILMQGLGGGPMIAKLFAAMMDLEEDYVRPFPIIDYKVPFNGFIKSEKRNK